MQFHQLVGQQLQRPGAASLRRLGAGQGDQAGLAIAVQLSLPAGANLLLADQSRLQTLLDKALANPLHGGQVDLDGLGDAVVGPGWPVGSGIGLEQDACVGQFQGRRLAGGDEVVERLAFGSGERDLVLLHGGILPVPPKYTEPVSPGNSRLATYYLE